MRNGRRTIPATSLAAMLVAASWAAEETEPAPDPALEPVGGAIVTPAMHHDTSPPLWLMADPPKPPPAIEHEPGRVPFGGEKPAPRGDRTGSASAVSPPEPNMPSPSLDFLGLGRGFPGFLVEAIPPDTNGDVGPNHYVQIVNTSFTVFDKNGTTVLFSPRYTNSIWQGFGGGCETYNDGDGIVLYDPLADRWLISQFVIHPPYRQCIAVSTTGNPTGQWHRYAFGYTDLPDYGKFGVWPDGYYATFNMFTAEEDFIGGKVCAFDRARMLSGQSASSICFDRQQSSMLPADLDGPVPPPPGAPNRIVALERYNPARQLYTWAFRANWASPGSSTLTPEVLYIEPTYAPCFGYCVDQPSPSPRLAALDDRLMYRLAYRNLGDHESLVVNHTVLAPGNPEIGIRWYEIRSPSTTPFLFQQGTHWVSDGADRWMASTAMDQAGDIAIGFSRSSGTVYPEIRYTGRLVTDPLDTMPQGEATLFSGGGGHSYGRWGDYSMMAVDPSDDCTFWYTSEYQSVAGWEWSTRAGRFKFASCPPPMTAVSNGPVCAGGSLQLVARGPNIGTYAWTGPNGFTSPARHPVIQNVGAAQTGVYTVTHYDQLGNPLEVRSIGVIVVPSGGICSDGNACTQTDTCQLGRCVGANQLFCSDTACTAFGACDPSTGLCPVRNNGAACEDGNVCTSGDACRLGECVAAVSMTAMPGVSAGGPAAVVLDDVVFDGIPDLAVAGGDAGTLDVAMGLGNGTFLPLGQSFAGLKPSAIVSGDFALTGAPEVAVADALLGTVTLYAVDLFGSWQLIPVSEPVYCGFDAVAMVAADFDGNGMTDVAVANQSENRVTVLRGHAPNALGFWWQGGWGTSPTALAAGDLNGDGLVDLAVTYGGSDDVAVLLGDGTGSFTPQTGSPYRVGPAPSGVAIGDFDGDGAGDLAVTNRDGSSVTVLLNRGASGFLPARAPIELGAGPLSLTTADFNLDGRLDLAVGLSDGSLKLLTGAGGGRFTLQAALSSGPSPVSLVARDLDFDGLPDLAVAHRSASFVGIHLSAPSWSQGAACEDGNPCTMNSSCSSGTCTGGVPTDSDGDGHLRQGCSGGDDCNDGNGAVWQPPVAVTGLTLAGSLTTNVSWDSQAIQSGPGTVYDLASGSLTPLDFNFAECPMLGVPDTSIIDGRPNPDPGTGYWYLPRARNACGTGTYGTPQRDTAIIACP